MILMVMEAPTEEGRSRGCLIAALRWLAYRNQKPFPRGSEDPGTSCRAENKQA